jgi:hypothetical protein
MDYAGVVVEREVGKDRNGRRIAFFEEAKSEGEEMVMSVNLATCFAQLQQPAERKVNNFELSEKEVLLGRLKLLKCSMLFR